MRRKRMFKVGQKVYFIRESFDRGSLRLFSGKVVSEKQEKDIYWLHCGGQFDNAFLEKDLFPTPHKALEHAFAENQKEQNKLAEQYQDLVRIEAELKLKEKKND
jgi:hypothetical protein